MGLRKRPFHYLKDNKRTELPYNIVFVDTETRESPLDADRVVHNLRLGVACYLQYDGQHKKRREKWLNFTTTRYFWAWVFGLCRPKIKLYIVAHNLEYDMPVLGGFDILKQNGWKYIKLINNHHTNIWLFRQGTTSLCFLDNMNYFNTSLAELGKSMGIPKLKIPKKSAPDDEWFIYCRRDVEVMAKSWDYLLGFIKAHDLGSFARSIPGQALNAYRHRFMPTPILIHDNHKAVEVERQSYYGGRVECFRLGQCQGEDFYRLDVNSMYPYVMSINDFPTRIRGVVDTPSMDWLLKMLEDKAVIAIVRVHTTEPCLPSRINSRLCFPTGYFVTVLSTPELKYAINKGYVLECYRAVVYDKASLFSHYVNHFYQLRLQYQAQGNTAFDYLCKLILNSLYGKFGQKLEVWLKVDEVEGYPDQYWREWDAIDKRWYSYRAINGVIERATGHEEGYNSMVAIPAHVTSYARLYLWQLLNLAGRDNLYYCDTDSLIVNTTGYHNLAGVIDPHALGMLKVEKRSKSLIINNVKDYRLGSEVKLKGIRNDAVGLGNNAYRQDQFRRFRGSLREGDINRIVVSKVTKNLTSEYGKGIIDSQGGVHPIITRVIDGKGYPDYYANLEKYGKDAIFPHITGLKEYELKLTTKPVKEDSKLDYPWGWRFQGEIDQLEKRSRGDRLW